MKDLGFPFERVTRRFLFFKFARIPNLILQQSGSISKYPKLFQRRHRNPEGIRAHPS